MLRLGGGRRRGTPNVSRAGEGDLEALVVIAPPPGRGQRAYRATLLLAALRVWLHPNGSRPEFALTRRAIERIRKLLACSSRTAWAVIGHLKELGLIRLIEGRESSSTGSTPRPHGAHLVLGGDSWGPCRVWARISRELYQSGLPPFALLLAGRLAARNGGGLGVRHLAEDFGLSLKAIETGLQLLGRRGIVHSRPGPRGRTYHLSPQEEQSGRSQGGRAADLGENQGAERQIPRGPGPENPEAADPQGAERQIPRGQSGRSPGGRAAETQAPPKILDQRAADSARTRARGGAPPDALEGGRPGGAPTEPNPNQIQAAARLLELAELGEGEPALTRGPFLERIAREFLEPPGRTLGLLEAVIGEARSRARKNPPGLLRDYLATPGRLAQVIARVAPKVVPTTTLAEAEAESDRLGAVVAGEVAEFQAEREAYLARARPLLEAGLQELRGLKIPELPHLEAAAGGFTARRSVTQAYGALHAWVAHQVAPHPEERHEFEHLLEAIEVWKGAMAPSKGA